MVSSSFAILFAVIGGWQFYFINCVKQKFDQGSIKFLPDVAVNEIVEFIGADNHLPSTGRYYFKLVSETYPIHRFVAKVVGIPSLAGCKGVNSDILDLLKLPKFKYLHDAEECIMYEIIHYGKYQSIKNFLFRYCLELTRLIGLENNNRLISEFYADFVHRGDFEVKLCLLDVVGRELASNFLSNFLLSWMPAEQKDFFAPLLGHPQGKEITRWLLRFGPPTLLIPYLVLHNVPEPWWIDAYLSLALNEKSDIFHAFPFNYIYRLEDEEFVRFERFFANYSVGIAKAKAKILLATFMIMKKDSSSSHAEAAIVSLFRRRPVYSLNQLIFALLHDAVEYQNVIYELKSSLIGPLFSNIIQQFEFGASRIEVREIQTAKAIKLFLAASVKFLKQPEWNACRLSISSFMKRLLGLYEIDRIDLDQNYFNALLIEGRLGNQKYAGFLPQHVTFNLPKSDHILNSCLEYVNTQNIAVLRFCMRSISKKWLESDFYLHPQISPSVCRAIQLSEEFYNEFISWTCEGKWWVLSPENVEIFSHPVDRLLGVMNVNIFQGQFLLKSVEQFERLLQLAQNDARSFDSKTILALYDDLRKTERSADYVEPELFFIKCRNFFRLWIRSSVWKDLSYIDKPQIFHFLQPEFPEKIREIRSLRAHRLAQESGIALPNQS